MGLIWKGEGSQKVDSIALSYSKRGLTLESMQEVVNGVLVQLEGLFVVFITISISGLLDQLDRFLGEGEQCTAKACSLRRTTWTSVELLSIM